MPNLWTFMSTIIVPIDQQRVQVGTAEVTIDANSIVMLKPANIPSAVCDSNQNPVPKLATAIHLSCGERVLIDKEPDEVKKLWIQYSDTSTVVGGAGPND